MGLDADTLGQLLAAQAVSSRGDTVPLAKYKFDGRHLFSFSLYSFRFVTLLTFRRVRFLLLTPPQ